MNSFKKSSSSLIGVIEGGGTKFVIGVADFSGTIIETKRVKTETPEKTLTSIFKFFDFYSQIVGFGIGTFGPLNLDPDSEDLGQTLDTPKKGWKGVNIKKVLERRYQVSVAIDTDVNVTALGCYKTHDYKSPALISYITVGTGIGIGSVFDGKIMRGRAHSEAGHSIFGIHTNEKSFCPFHNNCVEGLASGHAFKSNFSAQGDQIPISDPLWNFETTMLSLLIYNTLTFLAPDFIFIGGGLINASIKKPLIDKVQKYSNNYLPNTNHAELNEKIRLLPKENNCLIGAYFLFLNQHEGT